MSEPASTSEDPAVAYAELTLRVLERMTEFGMRKLERLDRLDSGEADDIGKTVDPAENFVTVSRAVRMTLVLGARTHRDLRELKAGIERRQAEEVINRAMVEARKPPWHDADKRTQRVRGLVHDIIRIEAESEAEYSELSGALEERLESDAPYIFGGDRPLGETVERLCRDLGMNPDMSLWSDDDWIQDKLPDRTSYSPFNKPSRKRLLNDDGEPLEAPDTPPRRNGHDLE
jgi:hypothetical protein